MKKTNEEEEVQLPAFLTNPDDDFNFDIVPPAGDDDEDEIEKALKQNEEAKKKKPASKSKKKKEVEEEVEIPEEIEEEEVEVETEEEEDDDKPTSAEDIISTLTSAYLEHSGLDLEGDIDDIKTPEEFFELIDAVIEERSVPEFASDDVKRFNDYVKNGGDPSKYMEKGFSAIGEYNLELESDQRRAVEDLLKRQGIPAEKIAKRVEKMIDRGDLEDEAVDALELLDEYKEKDRKKLEKEQEELNKQRIAQQRALIEDITKTINTLDNIGGVEISNKDKKMLMEYMLKPTSTGRTKWVEDQSKSTLPFITSAFFQMNSDKIIKGAMNKGQKSTLDKLKKQLSSVQAKSTGSTKRTKTDKPFWQ